MIQLKRESHASLNCDTDVKRMRGNRVLEATEIVDVNDDGPIRDEVTAHLTNAVVVKNTSDHASPEANPIHPNVLRERDLRRERGEMLLKLFREHPQLSDTATARKAEKNLERAQLWDKITCQINETFGDRLEMLSVEKTKKLLTYYKKKSDGNYEKIMTPSRSSLDEYQEGRVSDHTDPPSRCESVASEHGGFEGEPYAIVQSHVTTEADQHLRDFIASLGSYSDLSAIKSESPPSTIFYDSSHNLKKERHDFVVAIADHYLERMCFDNSTRSAQVNAERHNMWAKITHLTNEKYENLLSPLCVEQTKKLFSNFKRRRRLHTENSTDPLSSELSNSINASNISNLVPALGSYVSRDDNRSSHHLRYLMYGLDLSVEIRELRRQLAERETEVARLQRVIVEQANDYRSRINSVVDFFRTATDKKVAEDIRNYLGVS